MDENNVKGNCICVHCNTKIPHIKGKPCRENKCPKCKKKMLLEGSYHHQLYLFKKGETNYENSSTDNGECCG